MDLAVILPTFLAIFVVELPDKTFIAALVLSTRYRPWAVWVGVGVAFLIQTVIAVTVGTAAVRLLPEALIHGIAAAIFLIGAVLLIRAAPHADEEEQEQEAEYAAKATADRAVLKSLTASFLVLFAAEWGDLSQLLTVVLVGRYDDSVSVFVGAWAALLVVSGLAVVAGRVLLRFLRLSVLHYIGGAVCLLLAALTVIDLVS